MYLTCVRTWVQSPAPNSDDNNIVGIAIIMTTKSQWKMTTCPLNQCIAFMHQRWTITNAVVVFHSTKTWPTLRWPVWCSASTQGHTQALAGAGFWASAPTRAGVTLRLADSTFWPSVPPPIPGDSRWVARQEEDEKDSGPGQQRGDSPKISSIFLVLLTDMDLGKSLGLSGSRFPCIEMKWGISAKTSPSLIFKGPRLYKFSGITLYCVFLFSINHWNYSLLICPMGKLSEIKVFFSEHVAVKFTIWGRILRDDYMQGSVRQRQFQEWDSNPVTVSHLPLAAFGHDILHFFWFVLS